MPLVACRAAAPTAFCAFPAAPDAITEQTRFIQLDELWFDALDSPPAEPSYPCARADQQVPLTEDCRRCLAQIIYRYVTTKKNELPELLLHHFFPAIPTDIIATASSLYCFFTRGESPDFACLNMLGLLSTRLLGDGNGIAELALYIRETLADCLRGYYPGFGVSLEAVLADPQLSVALSAMAIVVCALMRECPASPSRPCLRIPLFMANLLLRASHYWTQLSMMASHATVRESHYPRLTHYNPLPDRLRLRQTSLQTGDPHCLPLLPGRHKTPCGLKISSANTPAAVSKKTDKVTPQRGLMSASVDQSDRDMSDLPYYSSSEPRSSQITQPLVAASVGVTLLSVPTASPLRSKVFYTAAGSLVGTVLLAGGKMLRHLFSTATLPQSAMSVSPQISSEEAGPLFLNRLTGYLNAHYSYSATNISNSHLALDALLLIFADRKHQKNLAHISLYGTGLYGESPDEYLNPLSERLLVGNMLSLLLSGQSIQDYLLKQFAAEGHISLQEFNKKVYAFPIPDDDEAVRHFFIRYYFYPLMPIVAIDDFGLPPFLDYATLLTGSPSWLVLALGAQASWPEDMQQIDSADDLMQHGLAILEKFADDKMPVINELVFETTLKIAALFANRDWTPQTLPEFPALWAKIWPLLSVKITHYAFYKNLLDENLEKYQKYKSVPWNSRRNLTREKVTEMCEQSDPFIYRRDRFVGSKIATWEAYLKGKNTFFCVGKKYFLQLPNPDNIFNKTVNEVTELIRNIDESFMNLLFIPNDRYGSNFSYDDQNFTIHAKVSLTYIAVSYIISYIPTGLSEMPAIPYLKSFKLKDDVVFLNATVNDETRVYVIKRDLKSYELARIDIEDIFNSLKPWYSEYPENNNGFRFSYYTDDVIASVSKTNLTTAIRELTKISHKKYSIEIYNRGYEPALSDVIKEVILEIFVPLYSCIKTLKAGDKHGALFSCGVDVIFVGLPVAGKLFDIMKKNIDSLWKLLPKLITQPRYIASKTVVHMNKITWRSSLKKSNLSYKPVSRSLTKDMSEMFVNIIDPGILSFIKLSKAFKKSAKFILLGDILHFFKILYKRTPQMTELTVRTISFTDSVSSASSSLLTSTEMSCSDNNDNYFCSSVTLVGDNEFNLLFFQGKPVFSGETGYRTQTGDKIYVIISDTHPKGFLSKFTCSSPESTTCELVPLPPKNISYTRVNALKVTSHENNGKQWILPNPQNASRLVFYPDYVCIISQDGYSKVRVAEAFELDEVLHLFFYNENYFRPWSPADIVKFEKRVVYDPLYSIIQTEDNYLVITHDTEHKDIYPPDHWGYASSANNQSITDIINNECKRETLDIFYSSLNKLVAKSYGDCYILNSGPLNSQFLIKNIMTLYPSFPVTWDHSDNKIVSVRPVTGESSVNTGLSLEKLIGENLYNCTGVDADGLLPVLIGGAVQLNETVRLKILSQYYRLGEYRNGLTPLYCENRETPLAWLHYDTFAETYEVNHKADNIDNTHITYKSSVYDKMIDTIYNETQRKDLASIINLFGRTDLRDNYLPLRLSQAAFLKYLNAEDRMATLYIPVAQIRAWAFHSEAIYLRERFPVLALWLGWQRTVTTLKRAVTTSPVRLTARIELENNFINNNIHEGKLFYSRYGRHQAVWRENAPLAADNTFQHPGALLLIYKDKFYAENITLHENMLKWLPHEKFIQSPNIHLFMVENIFGPEIYTDFYRKRGVLKHPSKGILEINLENREMEYIIVSPKGKWLLLFDSQRVLSFFNLARVPVRSSEYAAPLLLQASRSSSIPHDLSLNYYTHCALDDGGNFYYPDNSSWKILDKETIVWSPPQAGYQTLFITADHRFLAFRHPTMNKINIYDLQRNLARDVDIPGVDAHNKLVAVALSPMNALLALVFDNSRLYIYDLVGSDSDDRLRPVANFEFENDEQSFLRSNVIIRFSACLRYLYMIHDVGYYTDDDNSSYVRKFVFDHYLLSP